MNRPATMDQENVSLSVRERKKKRDGGVFKDRLLNVNCLRNSTFS